MTNIGKPYEGKPRERFDEERLGIAQPFTLANEVRDLDYQTALQQLMTLFLSLAGVTSNVGKQTVLCQLQQWMADLPLYIKGMFGNLCCES
ncbi:hypothetical protein B1748_09060 [Paenibacillus sp. MY03]|nr:hypothetical protein B1748_09060 [Paenibacillus sp. MY03]